MSQRTQRILFILLTVANLLPLTSRYLPFTDIQGHMGLVGGLIHWNDPEAHTREYYSLNPVLLLPSAIFHHWGMIFGRLFGVPFASNLFVGLTCVVGVPLALAYLLHAYGRDT